MTSRPAATALALVALSLLGGCSVKVGSDDDADPVVQTALAEGTLRVDLTDGLTRAEVGMPEGRSSHSIGHTGGRPPIAVTVVLADDRRVTRDVADVSFKPADLADPAAEPGVVELSQRDLDHDATRAVLERSIDELALPGAAVARWLDEAAAGPDDPYRTQVFEGPPIGGALVEVEVARFSADRYGVRTIFTLQPR